MEKIRKNKNRAYNNGNNKIFDLTKYITLLKLNQLFQELHKNFELLFPQGNNRVAWLFGVSDPPGSRAQYTATLTITVQALTHHKWQLGVRRFLV